MMTQKNNTVISRTVVYFAMLLLLVAIIIGALWKAPPTFLAVGFIGEIILGATAHLSSTIEQCGIRRST